MWNLMQLVIYIYKGCQKKAHSFLYNFCCFWVKLNGNPPKHVWGIRETITVLFFGLNSHQATHPSLSGEASSSWAETGPWMASRRQSSGGSHWYESSHPLKFHVLPNKEVSWLPWCNKTSISLNPQMRCSIGCCQWQFQQEIGLWSAEP